MKKFQQALFTLTRYLEIIITIAICMAIGISLLTLFVSLKDLYANPFDTDSLQNFLKIAFNILIGIEFIKMVIKYNVDTVIEVLLFAIARQLIVEHTSVYENCVGIISITLLFGIRKYFFVPQIDKDKDKKTD